MINAQHLKNARTTIRTVKKKSSPLKKKQEKWPNNKLGDRLRKKGYFFENKDFECGGFGNCQKHASQSKVKLILNMKIVNVKAAQQSTIVLQTLFK
jgi:hypothetical protein